MKTLLRYLGQLREYPSAMVGITIIGFLVVLSIITVIAIPRSKAVQLWRAGAQVWEESPKNAWPVWYDLLKRGRLNRTIVVDSRKHHVERTSETHGHGTREELMTLAFDYPYDTFPPEMTLFIEPRAKERPPHIALTWITPDGREIRCGSLSPQRRQTVRFGQDQALRRRLKGQTAEVGLFRKPDSTPPEPLKGRYQLQVNSLLFEPGDEVEAKLVVYGRVHGVAGTDHLRRDLLIALLWGTPVALSFGLLAAAGTTITTMTIAAFGVWYGGFVDGLIQRITEVNMILPLLPILIMIGTFYKRDIWVMLGVVILFSIFGAGIKSYRAIFLQVRTMPFVEAAQAYGASNLRIVRHYLVPRVLPLIVPSLVILVPAFVFLEASLAVLGLGDPVLPTWGKVIQNANAEGALFKGYYYWILEPALLLMLSGLAFAMVGFALDRIFNPRLREL